MPHICWCPCPVPPKYNKDMFSNWMHLCCYFVTISSHHIFWKINKVVDGMFHFGRNLMYYFCPFTDFMYVWWFQENEPEGQISQTLKELRNFTLAPPLPDFQVRHLVSELKSTATRSESQSRCWKTQKAPGLGLRLGLHQFTSKALSEKSTVMAKSQKKDTNIRFLFEA